ncbi:MAG: TonB-dependent receptor plug [Acidobacteriales bacterium]|nr:TonB-dependent receptor plug [Terriglobales bacterium]
MPRVSVFCRLMIFGLLVLSLNILNLSAQVAGGTIKGSVTDPSGALLPNAKITIKNVATGVVRETVSNTDGVYSAPNLAPGIYQMVIGIVGFNTQTQNNLTVAVGEVQVINVSMTVGSAAENIEVSSIPGGVELGTSEISGVIGERLVKELPLNGRDWTQLATLEPGVSAIRTENGLGNRVQQGEGAQMTISGGRPWQNNYRLDGISINDYANGAPGSALGINLGVDAVQEFSVLTSGYPAEYGRSSGGIINAVTKSGSNKLHGTAYEFFRDSALDARNYFDTGAVKPPFRRNQYGASLGAPIIKDRTFFFVDFEGIRQSTNITQVSTTPSAAARAGNLSSGVIAVNPAVLAFTNSFYPLPNGGLIGSGDTGIYSFDGPQITSENYISSRIDHHFTANDSMFSTYLFDNGSTSQPDEMNNKLFGYSTKRNLFTIEEDHTFSPRFLNSFRFGFNRVVALEGQTPSATNPAAGNPAFGSTPGLDAAQVNVPSLTSFSGGLGAFSQHNYHFSSIQEHDDASFAIGIHTIKFGGSIERIDDNYFAVAAPNGNFKFGSLKAYLQNQPKSFVGVIPGHLSGRSVRETIFAGYVQDDIRLRPNLTVNLGLRYEMATVPTEVNGKLATLRNLTDAAPHLGDPFFNNPTTKNFEPRVGLSWDPTGSGKTAIRSGFGMFDVLPLPYLFELTTQFTAPFFQQGNITNLPAGSFPTGAFALISANSNTLRSAYIQPDPGRNYVMHWNLNIQREINSGLTAMLAYVGSRGVHQALPFEDANSVLPVLTPAGYLYPSPSGSGTKLNPNFGRIGAVMWLGNSHYHALEAKVVKKVTHGFQIQGSYTWSKSIDNGSTSVGTDAFSNALINPEAFNPSLNKGLSDFDLRHNLMIHYTWTLGPTGGAAQRNGFASALIHGWEVGGILQASSGIPFNVLLGGDPLGRNTSDASPLPNRLNTPGCDTLTNPGNPVHYIKVECFAYPNPVTLRGNLGRNSLIGPGLLNLDSSLIKNTYIGERVNVQFRVEGFNVLNRANFAPPTSNNIVFDDDNTGQPGVPGAGLITSTATASRQIQFGLKVIF